MEIQYDPKGDVMYIRLSHAPVKRNHVVNDAMVVDLAEDGAVIGIELISPSRYVEDIDQMTFRFASKAATPPATVGD
jgi:uncharacterized protein YuzE